MIGLIVAAFVATIAFSFGREAQAADGRHVVIEIANFEFAPNAPILKPGDAVVWINRDIVPHTVTANDGSWGSGQIDAGGEWRMVVENDLFETYHCKFHPSMTGRLAIAQSAPNSEAALGSPTGSDQPGN